MQYTTQTSDFATVVFRQKALGFNAVRLPFRSSPPSSSPHRLRLLLLPLESIFSPSPRRLAMGG